MSTNYVYLATEYDTRTMTPTGRIEYYGAENVTLAVAACLYTHRLKDGRAHIGSTGLCVYSPSFNRSYAITLVK